MSRFKVGDRVRRKNEGLSSRELSDGDYVVESINHNGTIRIQGHAKVWDEIYFTSITEEPPKPWLKVTPPVPEKRQLVTCGLFGGLTIEFLEEDSAARFYLTSSSAAMNKSELRELGQTLIEISKEMK